MHDSRHSNVHNMTIACMYILPIAYGNSKVHLLTSKSVLESVDAAVRVRHTLFEQSIKRLGNLEVKKNLM